MPGFLEDYAMLAAGLLALHRAGAGGGTRLAAARRFVDTAAGLFARPGGGYFDTRAGQADLFVRVRSTWDGAVPTGNAVMIHNLLDLAELGDDPARLDAAVRDLRSFAVPLAERGAGMMHMQHALLRALEQRAEALAADGLVRGEAAAPVVASAAWVDDRRLRVTVTIGPGLHVNGHEVDEPGLVPTALELVGPGSIEVAWPQPVVRSFTLADRPLAVYEGTVTLEVTAEGLTGASSLLLTGQACSETVCLTPRTIAVTIPPR